MKTFADKTSENKSQAVAKGLPKLQSSSESTFQFVDNRPEAIAQRKLHEAIKNSPRVHQLKVYPEMANNSPHVNQLRTYQTVADNFTYQTVQRKENLEEETLQEKFEPIQKKENNTGLPDNLKSGIENLSGYSMDNVNVKYNSDEPAQLQLHAHAYAQGTDIHLASGQEKHLPHEAWHVVQQKQGRVKSTMQMKGKVSINDDAGLEKEADVMGARASNFAAVSLRNSNSESTQLKASQKTTKGIVQRLEYDEALRMLGEGVKELADTRFDHPIAGVYSKIRGYGPDEGIQSLEHYKPTELGAALKLSLLEEKALYAYSQPYKDDPEGAFFMGEHERWGDFTTGWNALNSAVHKLPSFKELGLGNNSDEVIPAFRTERSDSNFMRSLPDKAPCYIIHGEKSMGMTRHFASVSVMGESVHMKENQPTLRFECPSAKYIQAFGGMSTAVDGGEALIPPALITFCNGKSSSGKYGKQFTLREVGKDTLNDQELLDPMYRIIEDKNGTDVTDKYNHLYKGGSGHRGKVAASSSSSGWGFSLPSFNFWGSQKSTAGGKVKTD